MQNEKVRVSVAMASYNGEAYITEQIESILLNLEDIDEIVISDDGSSDRTCEIIKQYQKKEDRIRLIEGPRKGIKKNFENAIANCYGKYIFLADQDDLWHHDKVIRVLEIFEDTKSSLVMHDAKVVNAQDMSEIMPSFFAYRKSKAGAVSNIWKNTYMGCCIAFKKELIPYVLPIPDEIQMHDQWIGVINDLKGSGTYLLNQQLLYYKRHTQNNSDFSHNTPQVMLKNRIVFLKCLMKNKTIWKKSLKTRGSI